MQLARTNVMSGQQVKLNVEAMSLARGGAECLWMAMQAVQHKGAAQLLADQGLLSCLLAMAAWMVAPDGGGAPSAWLAFFATSPTDFLHERHVRSCSVHLNSGLAHAYGPTRLP